jgi:hypothetical protein
MLRVYMEFKRQSSQVKKWAPFIHTLKIEWNPQNPSQTCATATEYRFLRSTLTLGIKTVVWRWFQVSFIKFMGYV